MEFFGHVNLNGYIHAPDATVEFYRNANVTGGVAANRVIAHNQLTFTASDNDLPGGTTQARYSRTTWRECTPVPPDASNPASGC